MDSKKIDLMDSWEIDLIIDILGDSYLFEYMGDTVKVNTSYYTANGSYISFYITQRGNDLIITDGGDLYEDEYLEEFASTTNYHNKYYNSIISEMEKSYQIELFESCKKYYYFKRLPIGKIKDEIASHTRDMIQFILSSVNAMLIRIHHSKLPTN